MRTSEHTLNDEETWTKIAEDATNVLIQLRSSTDVEIFVGPKASTPGSSAKGIILWEGGQQSFGAANMAAGSAFWAKTAEPGESLLIVIEDGTDLGA